jgi:hypothetical protein
MWKLVDKLVGNVLLWKRVDKLRGLFEWCTFFPCPGLKLLEDNFPARFHFTGTHEWHPF